MFQKTKQKIRVRFSIMDPPAKPAKQKNQVAIENSLRLHTRGSPAASARWRSRFPSKNLTAHYDSHFCVSFHSGFAQEAQKCL